MPCPWVAAAAARQPQAPSSSPLGSACACPTVAMTAKANASNRSALYKMKCTRQDATRDTPCRAPCCCLVAAGCQLPSRREV